MIKLRVIGIGAAGNKAAVELLEQKLLDESRIKLINSNTGDIPNNYRSLGHSLSDETHGCGKERGIGKKLTISALKGTLGQELESFFDQDDKLCVIVTSTAGGTGSSGAPIIGKFIQEVIGVKVMIYAFTGFDEDVRGIKNTIEFFQELEPEFTVQSTSNKKFLEGGNNKLKAEKSANEEFCNRIAVISGQGIVDSIQNIDDTDLFKVVTTPGYMDSGFIGMEKIKNIENFNNNIIKHLDDTHSLETSKSIKRLAVVINLQDKYSNNVDYDFTAFKERFGTPYELFTHIQDEEDLGNGIWFISSGMDMPLEELEEIYERYQEETNKVNKSSDNFFEKTKEFTSHDDDDMFNVGISKKEVKTKESFFDSL